MMASQHAAPPSDFVLYLRGVGVSQARLPVPCAFAGHLLLPALFLMNLRVHHP